MAAKKKVIVPKLGISISNPEKVLYPAGQFTKTKVIDYYVSVAPFMLPHLHDRPVTLKRFPDGVFGQSFYEKDAPSFTPEWVQRTPVPRRDPSLGPIQYILVQDVRTLAWLANLACLELHPFLHRAPRLNQPSQIVFDLDPGEGVDILGCAEVAFLLQEVLSRLKLECFNPDGNSFQSLLVGYYADGRLHFAGKVRQGFRPALRRSLFRELKPLVTDRCPFVNLPTSKKAHFGEGVTADEMRKLAWLKPHLVAQCSFTEWTHYGLLRHATFIGLRDDKKPAGVIREQA